MNVVVCLRAAGRRAALHPVRRGPRRPLRARVALRWPRVASRKLRPRRGPAARPPARAAVGALARAAVDVHGSQDSCILLGGGVGVEEVGLVGLQIEEGGACGASSGRVTGSVMKAFWTRNLPLKSSAVVSGLLLTLSCHTTAVIKM